MQLNCTCPTLLNWTHFCPQLMSTKSHTPASGDRFSMCPHLSHPDGGSTPFISPVLSVQHSHTNIWSIHGHFITNPLLTHQTWDTVYSQVCQPSTHLTVLDCVCEALYGYNIPPNNPPYLCLDIVVTMQQSKRPHPWSTTICKWPCFAGSCKMSILLLEIKPRIFDLISMGYNHTSSQEDLYLSWATRLHSKQLVQVNDQHKLAAAWIDWNGKIS